MRRKEIDKPNGGIRLLGIPTVRDRVVQQALNDILVPIFDLESLEVGVLPDITVG